MRVSKIDYTNKSKWERKADPHERPHDFHYKDCYTKEEVINFWKKVKNRNPDVDMAPAHRFIIDNFKLTDEEVKLFWEEIKKPDSEKPGL